MALRLRQADRLPEEVAADLQGELPDHYYGPVYNSPNGASAVVREIDKLTKLARQQEQAAGRELTAQELMQPLPPGCGRDPDQSTFA